MLSREVQQSCNLAAYAERSDWIQPYRHMSGLTGAVLVEISLRSSSIDFLPHMQYKFDLPVIIGNSALHFCRLYLFVQSPPFHSTDYKFD